jgi:hypothetical protein
MKVTRFEKELEAHEKRVRPGGVKEVSEYHLRISSPKQPVPFDIAEDVEDSNEEEQEMRNSEPLC